MGGRDSGGMAEGRTGMTLAELDRPKDCTDGFIGMEGVDRERLWREEWLSELLLELLALMLLRLLARAIRRRGGRLEWSITDSSSPTVGEYSERLSATLAG